MEVGKGSTDRWKGGFSGPLIGSGTPSRVCPGCRPLPDTPNPCPSPSWSSQGRAALLLQTLPTLQPALAPLVDDSSLVPDPPLSGLLTLSPRQPPSGFSKAACPKPNSKVRPLLREHLHNLGVGRDSYAHVCTHTNQ